MRRKKGKGSLDNKGLIACGVIAVGLCVWMSVFHLTGGTDVLREGALLVSSPFVSFFDSIGRGACRVADAFMGEDEQRALWDEQAKAYENQLAVKELEISRLQGLKQENEQLRAYLALKEAHSSLCLLESRTIYTSDTSFRHLTLDKGSRDGVAVGMPVLDAQGLVGVVSEVFYRSCRVQTIMDESLKVGVRNARSGVSATLSGAAAGQGECTMRYMDPDTDFSLDLAVGDVIVTSGGSDIFPEGLVVGRISRLDLKGQMPTAYVKSAATPDDATSLLMIVTGEMETLPDPDEQPDGQPDGPSDGQPDAVPDDGEDVTGEGSENTENTENPENTENTDDTSDTEHTDGTDEGKVDAGEQTPDESPEDEPDAGDETEDVPNQEDQEADQDPGATGGEAVEP